MKKKIIILFVLAIGLIVVGCSTQKNKVDENIVGPYDEIAKCLTDKGIKMYGSEFCGACNQQKEYFNVSFQHIDYVNCDGENVTACRELGIPAFPTWMIDGKFYEGARTPESLAEVAGCSETPDTNIANEDIVLVGPYDELAKCLTNKGIKMYGADWCGVCKRQKTFLNVSFQHIDYVNCDENWPVCKKANITGYPTWIIDGEHFMGSRTPEQLAELSGCVI